MEVLKTLFQAPRWKAKYVGEMPQGVEEVVRETFECFSIVFSSELDAERMKEICVTQGFLIKDRDSRKEDVYYQFGKLIETRIVEWTYPFRIVDSEGEIVLFADSSEPRKIYLLPLTMRQGFVYLREDVILAIDEYRREKYG